MWGTRPSSGNKGSRVSVFFHGQAETRGSSEGSCFGVAGIGMTQHSHSWIGGQHTLQAERCFAGSIGHYYHARMLGIANAYSAAVMNADPGCSRRRVHQRVQQGPIGYCVGAV